MKKTIDIAQMMADMIDNARSRGKKETKVRKTVDDSETRGDAKLNLSYDGKSGTVSADVNGRNGDLIVMLAGIMERSEDLIPVFIKAALVALRSKGSDADDKTYTKIQKLHELFDQIMD